MKKILCAILLCIGCTVAYADCAENEFEYNDGTTSTCIEAKFTVTTTEMNADETFNFSMYVMGTFYVDWGDGTVEQIIGGYSIAQKSHTYATASNENGWNIRFGGIATGYNNAYTAPVIGFANNLYVARISGSLGALFPSLSRLPMFRTIFQNCTNLSGTLPNGLFDGITGTPRDGMFADAFKNTNISGALPNGLFAGIHGTMGREVFNSTFWNTKITSVGENFLGTITGRMGYRAFYSTFNNCTELETVPPDMFDIDGAIPGDSTFSNTFKGCTKLRTMPVISGFNGAPAASMFNGTFAGCTSLTGPIPSNMFSGISGPPASLMFYYTFYNCTNLSGTIPENLFSGIIGAPQSQMFLGTFRNTNLTGYIPPNLFAGISTDSTASNQMQNIFAGTNLFTTCPCGTRPYTTKFENYFNLRGSGANTVYAVSCEIGTKSNEHWHNGICTTDCTLGIKDLKTDTGLDFPILADKVSTPAINIGYNDAVCYVPLESGTANNAINISDGTSTYHAVVPDEIMPTGFTGQPD